MSIFVVYMGPVHRLSTKKSTMTKVKTRQQIHFMSNLIQHKLWPIRHGLLHTDTELFINIPIQWYPLPYFLTLPESRLSNTLSRLSLPSCPFAVFMVSRSLGQLNICSSSQLHLPVFIMLSIQAFWASAVSAMFVWQPLDSVKNTHKLNI